jgi:hypothetical protein
MLIRALAKSRPAEAKRLARSSLVLRTYHDDATFGYRVPVTYQLPDCEYRSVTQSSYVDHAGTAAEQSKRELMEILSDTQEELDNRYAQSRCPESRG